MMTSPSNRHLVAVLLIEGSLSLGRRAFFLINTLDCFFVGVDSTTKFAIGGQMPRYVAKRFRFQNGEHHSVLKGPDGLPVHAVTLFLQKFRKRGRAANTIHAVCQCLALLYRELDANLRVDIVDANRKLTIF
ncbi:MAG: hypothetical protein ACK4F8_15260 [Aquabacterium sp.]